MNHDAWKNVLEYVDAVSMHLKTAPRFDRSVINALRGNVHYSRSWALHLDGRLSRCKLITKGAQETLSEWLGELAERIAFMLDGEAYSKYDQKRQCPSTRHASAQKLTQ